ncbi:MAG: FAD-dependent oxidoreductase, partial [Rickettsiales bacterium]
MTQFGYNIKFAELYQRDGLVKVDDAFVGFLKTVNLELFNRLMAARASSLSNIPSQVGEGAISEKEYSQLIVDVAPYVEDFIGELFGIKKEIEQLAEAHHALAPIYSCKRLFVQRKAAKSLSFDEAQRVDGRALLGMLPLPDVSGEAFELAFAKTVNGWLENESENKSLLEIAARYAAWALFSEAGKKKHKSGVLFKQPVKTDYENLVAAETERRDGVQVLRFSEEHLREREGFALTDDGGTRVAALDSANYCIFCHNQGKDSCSKGLKEKSGEVKVNPLGITQAGCPLEEKISEMNMLKSQAVPIGALAAITIDNPMCAGTGYRICNDCMKSCIYQKQEPVNIPHVETFTLRDVLSLPYGFEIYSLLTRWNPLNLERPVPKPESGYKVLVAGLGPAGYTLAHHLMNDGHTVVGIDGLKIEPVDEKISGVRADGSRCEFTPIKYVKTIYEKLDERTLAGFGGVAEYGITVRWDKNYLKIIRLLLERRQQFAMFGGVRFGSSLTYDNAFEMGFDHIALCMGAGKPTVLDIPNALARGVRTASDFLMALQLTGAGKKDSIANLQIRLPIVVIGGGLTAIDTATESLAYYPIQVEKFLARYEILTSKYGKEAVRSRWSKEDTIVAEEFLAHARAIRKEREKENPDIWGLLDSWGGVKLVYRKRMIDAPSYRLNHEEVEKAFEEGIFFAEQYEPAGMDIDEFGAVQNISLKQTAGDNKGVIVKIPARMVLVAAGTSPNTVLNREDAKHFELDGKYFRAVDENGKQVTPERISKPNEVRVLLSVDKKGRAVSFFGDLHPSFAGNVVKAMGSAKQGYPVITKVLQKRSVVSGQLLEKEFIEKMNNELRATVHAVNRLTSNIVEVVVRAPLAARQFQPGQFYRLQNYEKNALRVNSERCVVNGKEGKELPPTDHHTLSTTLAMEGLALTGAWVDKEEGLLATIVLEMGGSSDLCSKLKAGEQVILMGPTGTPTEIPKNKKVMLLGGGLGNAVLFSIGKAMRDNGCEVLYFAGYKKATDRYKIEDIEVASDIVVWCCDEQSDFAPNRPQDMVFHGN